MDTAVGAFLGTVARLEIHRGLTHSILFALIVAPILGWLLTRIYKKEDAGWRDWSLLMFLALFTHALLDCFTTWGTQLFWPLDYRIAWQSIFVIDPVYTVPLLVCVVWLMFKDRKSLARRNLNLIGLTLSTLY